MKNHQVKSFRFMGGVPTDIYWVKIEIPQALSSFANGNRVHAWSGNGCSDAENIENGRFSMHKNTCGSNCHKRTMRKEEDEHCQNNTLAFVGEWRKALLNASF